MQNAKEQKKEYVEPTMKVVELKHEQNLMQISIDPKLWDGEGA